VKGFLLNITSIVDGIGMNVTFDGMLVAAITVDAYWHVEYVPTDEPVPTFTSEVEPTWVEGHYFPRFPASDRVYVIHVPTVLDKVWRRPPSRPDWRITHSNETMMALTLVGMQGVINRYGPRVYLDWEDGLWNISRFWLAPLRSHIETVHIGVEGLDAIRFLAQRYGPLFNGSVVYDPEVPDTINLATMLAGLENRLILAPEQLDLPGGPRYTNVLDLRPLVQAQAWNTSEESKYQLYQWVYDHLWPRLERRMIGIISPGPPTSRRDNGGYFPLGMAARDYLVALRLPVLWLSPSEEPQASLFAQFLADAPSPIPVLGFFAADEPGTVDVASSYGNWVPVITNGNGPLDGGSLSVFSGVRPAIQPYRSELDLDRLFATLGTGPVVTLWGSDGDSILILMNNGWVDVEQFLGYSADDYLYGLSINPTLIDLAPVIWNHFVQNRSAVQAGMICGLSGAGYATPYYMSDDALDAYLTYTARYLNATGLRTVWRWRPWVDDAFGWEMLETDLDARYHDALNAMGYLGLYVGNELSGRKGLGFYYNDVPPPSVTPGYSLDNGEPAGHVAHPQRPPDTPPGRDLPRFTRP
jgi:hypothetical protein